MFQLKKKMCFRVEKLARTRFMCTENENKGPPVTAYFSHDSNNHSHFFPALMLLE